MNRVRRASITPRAHSDLCLTLLTIAVGYAVITNGGDGRRDAAIVLLIIGLTAVLASVSVFRRANPTRRKSLIDTTSLLLLAAVACQLVPLPLTILTFASPARAELANALGGIIAVPHFAPL